MATILPFLKDAAFGPEATHAMGVAFEKACSLLGGGEHPAVLLETIAKRIVAHAQDGENDPDRLCDSALAALGERRKEAYGR